MFVRALAQLKVCARPRPLLAEARYELLLS
jgi:hypothetical protein